MRAALLVALCLSACRHEPKPPPLTAEDRAPKVIVGQQGETHVCGPAEWRLEERWYLDRDCELVRSKPDPEIV
jgi:hypothetical protein